MYSPSRRRFLKISATSLAAIGGAGVGSRLPHGADQGYQDRSLVHVTEVPASTPLGPIP